MSLPVNANPGNLRPVEVLEDDTHFLVRIHPEDRDRAKKIVGRQWDGDRKAWVYPKDQITYEALKEEFQRDANSFDIRRPKTQRPIGITPPDKSDESELEDQLLEEIRSLGNVSGGQSKILDELEQIQRMLGSLGDVAANQSRTLSEVRETQEQTAKAVEKFELPIQQVVRTEPVEIFPDSLDLTKQKEIELFEKAIILLACQTANEQKSFCDWVKNYKPLREPADFVNETHEFLKKQLCKIVEEDDCRASFYTLVKRIRDERLIYFDRNDPDPTPIAILFALNDHRNRYGHPFNFKQSEKWGRSILYLMNLALIWSKVVMEAEDSDE
ncbi:hypothetical protein [Phormidesmis sp. 146-33]